MVSSNKTEMKATQLTRLSPGSIQTGTYRRPLPKTFRKQARLSKTTAEARRTLLRRRPLDTRVTQTG